jgi:hypothetical protein
MFFWGLNKNAFLCLTQRYQDAKNRILLDRERFKNAFGKKSQKDIDSEKLLI